MAIVVFVSVFSRYVVALAGFHHEFVTGSFHFLESHIGATSDENDDKADC
jgi:hypothetical protein